MEDDSSNKGLQQMIFFVSLLLVVAGITMVITSGLSKIFEFQGTLVRPLTTNQQPFILVLVFAIVALYYSSSNLKKMRNSGKNKAEM